MAEKCLDCKGTGKKLLHLWEFGMAEYGKCPTCHGTGKVEDNE